MRIAVLVKQVPKFDAMELGPDGRLVREGLELEMNPYCRRAVAKGAELAAATGGTATVFTLGPPSAEDSLREAIAWGATDGVLVTDRAFAGSDTLATARALAAALDHEGPFDLVLAGRNSVDADTGQVGPAVAELLDLAFATGVKRLELGEGSVKVLCEEDDGASERIVALPTVLSCAERLCDPAKVDPTGRAAVAADRIRTLAAADLGPGPWGEDGSPTWVGEVRVLEDTRERIVLAGPVEDQITEAMRRLADRGALVQEQHPVAASLPEWGQLDGGRPVLVVAEPGRDHLTRELLGAAARLATEIGGHVAALTTELDAANLWAGGADKTISTGGRAVEEDVAGALAMWASDEQPWAVLAPSTTWGREVAARAAARLGAGLTGDAVDLEVSRAQSTGEALLLAWKPAFGGQLVAAIYCGSPVQMATVRAGVLPLPPLRALPQSAVSACGSMMDAEPRGRVRIIQQSRDDDLDALATAHRVVGIGKGVHPDEYPALEPLLAVLDAELAATRKVTDNGWLPRARQVGITGRSIAPRLYIGLGMSGKFNHTVGVRAAGTVLAVNSDPEALLFGSCDIGIVADWREVVPGLTERLRLALS